MSPEGNKAIARRHYEELWNRGDLAVADEIYSTNAVGHDFSSPEHRGYPECEKQLITAERAALSDNQVTIEDQVAEGDRVVTRWTSRARHTGVFMGMAGTGKEIISEGVHIHRIAGGKIVEIWAYPDAVNFMRQLGLISVPW